MIKTERLLLRQWRNEDFLPFSQITSDPRTTEFFSTSALNREESDRLADSFMAGIEKRGWGFWAVSVPGVSDFIGYIGLSPVDYKTHFTPAVGIGWQLSYDYWGKGYATEGAKEVLRQAFTLLKLDEVVSITVPGNKRSIRVMEKIGLHRRQEDDFDHPILPIEHPLKKRILYRLRKEEWLTHPSP